MHRDAGGQSDAFGAGGPDRLFRQHAGAAGRPGRLAELRGGAAAGAGVALEAFAHQDMPFEKLVAELRPARDLSRNPLFQVMFVLQNTPMPTLKLPGLELKQLRIAETSSNFDLSLSLIESEGKLRGGFEYPPELFDESTISRLVGHFQTLLTGAVADPDRPVQALPILGDTERRLLLHDWNDTTVDLPLELTLTRLVQDQATRCPDSIAVAAEDAQLSYAALEAQADRLAQHLLARRAAPGPRRRSPGPLPRADRRPAGGAQGRRRVCAAGPQLPSRAAGLHARRRPRGGGAQPHDAGRRPAPVQRPGGVARRRRNGHRGVPGGAAGGGGDAR